MKNRYKQNFFKADLSALTPQREKDGDNMCIAGSFLKRLDDFLIGRNMKF